VNHDPYNPDQGTGPEEFKQRVSGYRSVLHDFDLRIERQTAEGDMVETHWSLRGTHGGELEGTAPTGKSVYVDGQLLSRIVDGKFVEEWVHWDTLGLLRQIGAVPPPHRDHERGPGSNAAPGAQATRSSQSRTLVSRADLCAWPHRSPRSGAARMATPESESAPRTRGGYSKDTPIRA
jgi:predicted ester cyclase